MAPAFSTAVTALFLASSPVVGVAVAALVLYINARGRGDAAGAAKWRRVARATAPVLTGVIFIALPLLAALLAPTTALGRIAPYFATGGALGILLIAFPWGRYGRAGEKAFWVVVIIAYAVATTTLYLAAAAFIHHFLAQAVLSLISLVFSAPH